MSVDLHWTTPKLARRTNSSLYLERSYLILESVCKKAKCNCCWKSFSEGAAVKSEIGQRLGLNITTPARDIHVLSAQVLPISKPRRLLVSCVGFLPTTGKHGQVDFIGRRC
ncbi:unnamed protein product [Calypogeia fissa]